MTPQLGKPPSWSGENPFKHGYISHNVSLHKALVVTGVYLSRLLNMFSTPHTSAGDHVNTSSQPQQPMLCQLVFRRSLGNGLVELRHGTNAEHASRWLQVSHTFQPSVPRLDVQLEQTTVSLAFNLEGEAPMQQQVYAFLPLRSYGLSFIVQVSSQLQHIL